MAHFLSQSWLINRRHALRAMGTCISLPLLDCMRPLRAAEQVSAPRRSVFIYFANGINIFEYQITKAGKDYEISRALKPLEKFRDAITPISGMSHPGSRASHHNCIRTWLTDGQFGPSIRNTISVDQLIAQVTAQQTRYASLEIAANQESLAWTADGINLPPLRRCNEVFEALFGAPAGGKEVQRRRLRQKGSVLDFNLEEVRRLERELGAVDKGRMEQYLTSVRETEIRTQRADAWLDTPLPNIAEEDRKRTNRDVPLAEAGEYYRTMYDLLVLALQTDVTRVATFSMGGEGHAPSIPELGMTQTRHMLSHHGGDPVYLEHLAKYDSFIFEQFAYFLNRLAETQDAGGKPLLNSTMALIGSGMSNGHGHGNTNLPLVLAGGKDLGLKHGQHIDFNLMKEGFQYDLKNASAHYRIQHQAVNPDAHMSNLLLMTAQKMGVETDRFGESNGLVHI
jgi:hypothetical protein